MNHELEALAQAIGLIEPGNGPLRLAFSSACVERVRHLLEQAEVIACLDQLSACAAGSADAAVLARTRDEAAQLANQHRGSKSIDGCGHAAVSASYAVANALADRPLEAASYASYASVYASGGYAGVAEREAFGPEFAWQVATLRRLADARAGSS